MTENDFICLLPLIILSAAPVIIMLTIAVVRNYKVIYGFSLLFFLVSFLSIWSVFPLIPHKTGTLFIIDGYSLLFLAIILIASALLTILSFHYLKLHKGEKEEYFIIIFVASLGASILVTANHFVTFFLGIETLSVSLFILIAYLRGLDYCIEGGVKYLIMASVASAFLLFGLALIYAASGTMNFEDLGSAISRINMMDPVMLTGIVMLLAGIGFKLAVVPFHMWTPDVYQGAPAPVTAFIATISKGAVLAVVLRFFISLKLTEFPQVILVVSSIAILSMFTGNLLALRQNNIKRLLAYSSIAHLGYLLITLIAGSGYGVQAAIFYVVSYIITTLGAFGVVSVLSGNTENDLDLLENYRGLFWQKPWPAIVMSLSMLSLAGIPLTAGFMSKFYLAFAGIHAGLWILVISLIINSVISLYYYLRVITAMFSAGQGQTAPKIPVMGNLVLAIISVGIIALGIFPGPLIDLITKYSMIP